MSKTTEGDNTLTELLENAGFTGEFLDNSRKLFEETLLARVDDVKEDLEAKFEAERGNLVEALDLFLEQALGETVDDVRKMMLLAVSQLGGPDAVDAYIKKLAAMVRDGALSASSADWASGSDDDSASNRDSIRGGGVSTRKEEIEIEEARAVFDRVADGLDEEQVEEFKDLVGDMTYSGDVPGLRSKLTTVRNQNFANPLTEHYVDAISRTVRKG